MDYQTTPTVVKECTNVIQIHMIKNHMRGATAFQLKFKCHDCPEVANGSGNPKAIYLPDDWRISSFDGCVRCHSCSEKFESKRDK